MISDPSYRKSFIIALIAHLSLALLLLLESTSKQPVLVETQRNQSPQLEQPIIKAVSIEQQEVFETVKQLKQQKERELKAEQQRQLQLKLQAEKALQSRLQEQKRLAQLKEESRALALVRKKQQLEELKRLEELAKQKEHEAKHLEELKAKRLELQKKQEKEQEKLVRIKKQQEHLKKLEAERDRIRQEKAKAIYEEQKKARIAEDHAREVLMTGEVNKYKAMIVNAISRHWILPDQVDNKLSSQFRIRLAPNGAVLEVTLIRSSGNVILDRSAQTAIYKASPLPVPSDPTTFAIFRDISLTVRPEQVRG